MTRNEREGVSWKAKVVLGLTGALIALAFVSEHVKAFERRILPREDRISETGRTNGVLLCSSVGSKGNSSGLACEELKKRLSNDREDFSVRRGGY